MNYIFCLSQQKMFEESQRVSGVYCIKNTTKNKYYIGQTNNLKLRLKQHEHLLKNGEHYNNELQKDYNLGNKFCYMILEVTNKDKRELKKLESKYIDLKKNVYNITKNNFNEKTFSTNSKTYYKRSFKYMCENYDKEITLKELSLFFNLNYSYLSYVFKNNNIKESFMETLIKIRIDKAKCLLKNTNKTTKEISTIVGYANGKNFYKIFKNYTGLTPTEYRKNLNK